MRGVWTSYSARHAAQLIGLPESAIRSCIRDGLVGTPGTVPAQLTFRDLSALRTVKALVDAGLPLPRVRRELVRIQLTLPDGASLAELTIEARGGQVLVRGGQLDAPLCGQLALPFDFPAAEPGCGGDLRELPRPSEAAMPPAVAPATAEQWMARALHLEDRDPVAAIDAYRRSLRLRPDCTEAWINLGRMFAEAGDPTAARECFSSAVELDPGDATAHYNLDRSAPGRGALQPRDAVRSVRRLARRDPPHQRVPQADAVIGQARSTSARRLSRKRRSGALPTCASAARYAAAASRWRPSRRSRSALAACQR
ncbi:MAG: tetratricopeptide repeat protein [Deltaproteobacteria bacterium]|nr:MAG: tetratricopeptide repeat protein [Deltaproteobacteria bacterium]